MRGVGPILGLVFATAALIFVAPPGPAVAAGTSTTERQLPRSASSAQLRPAPLHLGTRGSRVRALQQRLAALGYLPSGSIDGVFGAQTWHAVVAFQGWQRLHRDGIVGARTRTALVSATRPQPWIRFEHALALDLDRQVMLVVRRGRTARAVHISSAAPGYVTPRGRFRVYRRERLSWSVPYRAWMPYALYFSGGYAVHAFSRVPARPASHGCVRMPVSEAPFVYAATPLRTPVVIR